MNKIKYFVSSLGCTQNLMLKINDVGLLWCISFQYQNHRKKHWLLFDVTIYRDIAGRRVSDVYMIHTLSRGFKR